MSRVRLPRRFRWNTPWILAAVLTLEPFASPSPSPSPSPRELLRNHYRSAELTVIVGLEDPANEPRLRDALTRHRLLRSANVRFVDATRATQADLARGSVALIGSKGPASLAGPAGSNPALEELLSQLPLRRDAVYRTGDSVQLVYPNPLFPSHPVVVFAGGSDEDTLTGLETRRNAELHIRRMGKTIFLGHFHDDWTLDSERSRVFGPPTRLQHDSTRFAYYLHGMTELEARPHVQTLDRLGDALGDAAFRRALDVHLYPSLEYKGLVTGNTRPAHFEGRTIHAAFDDGWRPEALVAEKLVPTSGVAALSDGRAYRLAYDEDTLAYLDALAVRLVQHNPEIGLDDPSRFAREALSASLAGYAAGRTPEDDPSSLEHGWRRSLAVDDSVQAGSVFPRPPAAFLSGVNFTQEGFAVHDGYLSRSSEASLDKLVDLGANAVAVVPYAFMRDGTDPRSLAIPEGPGAETDESVIHAIRAAKRRGMTVLLKPQIWIRGGWPGDIRFEDELKAAEFFEVYRRWIRHYALMADRYGAEWFAFGTELAGMSGGHEAHWRTLIQELRALYRGRLVYAANWGHEVDNVVFWPLVDAIGVDFYYPLSTELEPSDEALELGFDRSLATVRAIGERHEKPVLLTEVGYASTERPWVQPHASDRSPAVAPEAQARAYEAAFRAMADELSWLRGAFWWKWPTTLAIGGPNDRTFTPNGKPAEDVMRRWFRELHDAPR